MTDYFTNMNTLLTAVKNRLLAYQNTTLSSVKTYKKGILPPLPAFPAVVILPVSETFSSPRSNRVYRNDRALKIELYTKGLKTDNVLRDGIDLSGDVKNILKTEFLMNDGGTKNTYDTVIGEMTYGEPQPYRNQMVQKCTIPITCRSLERYPSAAFTTAIDDYEALSLLDKIYSTIDNYSYSVTIKRKDKATLPPCPAYPSIHVLEDSDIPNREEAGIDIPLRKFTIACFNKLLDKDIFLTDLVTIAENIKDCLQTNERFDNYIRMSHIESIQYGTYSLEQGALYSAFIFLNTFGHDPVPSIT